MDKVMDPALMSRERLEERVLELEHAIRRFLRSPYDSSSPDAEAHAREHMRKIVYGKYT